MASTERAPDAATAAARRESGAPRAEGEDVAAEDAASARRLLLFAVHRRLYGCHIYAVREIIPFRPCTRLPGAPSFVCGLINLRGTIVTVLDLGARLGGEAIDRADGSIVLVEHGTKVVGLGVDELRDVQVVPYEPLAPGAAAAASVGNAAAPEAPAADDVGRPDAGVMLGLGSMAGELVVVLDVRAIVKQALL